MQYLFNKEGYLPYASWSCRVLSVKSCCFNLQNKAKRDNKMMINCNFHTLYCAKIKMVKSNLEYTGFYYFQQDLNKEPQKKTVLLLIKQATTYLWKFLKSTHTFLIHIT